MTVLSVTAILGLMPRDIYFEIDQAGKEGRFVKAFEIAHRVFAEGKDLTYFIEGLVDHLRQILLLKVAGPDSPLLALSSEEKKNRQSARFYTQEQCLTLIEYLLQAQNQLRITPFGKISLEAILLHVMQSHFRLPIEQLVRRLSELEHLISEKGQGELPTPTSKPLQALQPPVAAVAAAPKPLPPQVVKPVPQPPVPQPPVAASPARSCQHRPLPDPRRFRKERKSG